LDISNRFLNPGGTLELIDIVYPLQSDDGTLSEESSLSKWSKMLLDGFTANGRPLDSALKYKEQLTEAGFVDVNVVKRKWPLNRWPKNQKYKQIGKFSLCQYSNYTTHLRRSPMLTHTLHHPGAWAYENTLEALAALSLAVFTRPLGAGGLGWSTDELEVMLAAVRKDLKNPNIHSYWPMYVLISNTLRGY
jgi:hypothetical protein